MIKIVVSMFAALLCASTSAYADAMSDCQSFRDMKLAIEACTQLIQKAPNNDEAYYHRALKYSLTNEADKAIADQTKVIDLKGKRQRDGLLARGDLYFDKKDYDKVIADVTAGMKMPPGEPSLVSLSRRAIAYLKTGKQDLARADAEAAVKIHIAIPNIANSAIAYLARAEVHEAAGKRDAAIADFRKAFALGSGRGRNELIRLGVTP